MQTSPFKFIRINGVTLNTISLAFQIMCLYDSAINQNSAALYQVNTSRHFHDTPVGRTSLETLNCTMTHPFVNFSAIPYVSLTHPLTHSVVSLQSSKFCKFDSKCVRQFSISGTSKILFFSDV